MYSVYVGTIEKVFAPNHQYNANKYQYEYSVLVSMDGYNQVSVPNCIKADTLGGFDDFEDTVLSPGNLVLVSFVRDELKCGIIMSCIRNFTKKTEVDRAVHWRKRFNKFETAIDSKYNWSAKSDFGPNAHIMVDKIILDDSQGQKITLDKNTKTITVEAELWTIEIRKDVKMTVGGNVTATVVGNVSMDIGGNANVNVHGALSATVDKDATLAVKGNAVVTVDKSLTATVKGRADVKADQIFLNSQGEEFSSVTTEYSHQGVIDLVTGVPCEGVQSVKAGHGMGG